MEKSCHGGVLDDPGINEKSRNVVEVRDIARCQGGVAGENNSGDRRAAPGGQPMAAVPTQTTPSLVAAAEFADDRAGELFGVAEEH